MVAKNNMLETATSNIINDLGCVSFVEITAAAIELIKLTGQATK
jgi:hypothetical protein